MKEQKTVVVETHSGSMLRRALRNGAAHARNYLADKSGAIAVETAILTPLFLFGMLLGGNLGFSVYNHQKVYTAAYSGASFLHDKVAAGDLSGLTSKTNEQGETEVGEWITTAKLVIKDASGLPLNLGKIGIDAYCACPAVSPGELISENARDEMDGRQNFYEREQLEVSESGQICPKECENGNTSRVIAEIIIDHDTKLLTGGQKTIRETLVTRLR